MSKVSAGTHEINRRRICFICHRLPKVPAKIQGKILERLEKLFDKIEVLDERFPAVVCGSCRVKLVKNGEQIPKMFPHLAEYESFKSLESLKKRVNLKGSCDCKLCVKVRSRKGISTIKNHVKASGKKQCVTCSKLLSRGLNHICSSKVENVVEMIEKKFEQKEKDQILTSLLKSRLENMDEKRRGEKSIKLAQVRGKPLPVIVHPAKTKELSPMPTTKMAELQRNFNFTNRQTIGIAKAFREGVKNRKAVENNFEKKLNIGSHIFDNYFETRKLDFTKKTQKEELIFSEDLVVCNNLKGLIQYIVSARNLSEYHVKFGIDGGGGS